jgi:hypothetical protein
MLRCHAPPNLSSLLIDTLMYKNNHWYLSTFRHHSPSDAVSMAAAKVDSSHLYHPPLLFPSLSSSPPFPIFITLSASSHLYHPKNNHWYLHCNPSYTHTFYTHTSYTVHPMPYPWRPLREIFSIFIILSFSSHLYHPHRLFSSLSP